MKEKSHYTAALPWSADSQMVLIFNCAFIFAYPKDGVQWAMRGFFVVQMKSGLNVAGLEWDHCLGQKGFAMVNKQFKHPVYSMWLKAVQCMWRSWLQLTHKLTRNEKEFVVANVPSKQVTGPPDDDVVFNKSIKVLKKYNMLSSLDYW